MKRIKRILSVFAVNTAILTAGILIIELFFGGWLKPTKLNRLFLIRDQRLAHNVSKLYKSQNPIVHYSRDKYGLRGNYSDPADIYILTVGGSTTDQRYIRDGETWQDVLQKHFARQGDAVVIANAGVDGQSTVGHIANFKWWFPHIPDLKPGFILFYVGLNDFYIDGKSDFDDLNGRHRNATLKSIRERSALWRLIRTLHGTYTAMVKEKLGHQSVDFKEIQWSHDALQNNYGFMEPRLKAYAHRLRILSDLTRAFGAKPVFISQPSRLYRITRNGVEGWDVALSYDGHQWNGVDFYHMITKMDSVTMAVATQNNAPFIDLASYTDWEDSDFYDMRHMTPKGTYKMGTFLFHAIKEIVLCEKSQNKFKE